MGFSGVNAFESGVLVCREWHVATLCAQGHGYLRFDKHSARMIELGHSPSATMTFQHRAREQRRSFDFVEKWLMPKSAHEKAREARLADIREALPFGILLSFFAMRSM